MEGSLRSYEVKMKKIIIFIGILLLSAALVYADEGHQSWIEEGKKLVESWIS